MTRQWLRRVRLTVSGSGGSVSFDGTQDLQSGQVESGGFKIGFNVAKTIGSKQNTASITIWNLTKSNRNKLGEEFDKVKLEVGYKDSGLSLLYEGDIRDVTHTKDSADVQSSIECGDGDKAVNKGAVSKTFPSGTKPKAVMEYLISQMPGARKGKIVGIDDAPAFKRPVTVYGWSAQEMDKMGRHTGSYWNIHNGEVNVVKNDKHLGEAAIVSSETGMIGIPEETDKGIKFKALLNTKIVPGRLVDVRSGFLDDTSGRDKRASDAGGGLFRVASATFTGDTRAEEFFVEVEANRVQGDKVVK